MTTDKNLWEEQVSRAKKLLENLPPKDSKKTKKEAASELEEDFKKAMSHGYTAAQISDILKNEGIDIPAYIIKKVCKGLGVVGTGAATDDNGVAVVTVGAA